MSQIRFEKLMNGVSISSVMSVYVSSAIWLFMMVVSLFETMSLEFLFPSLSGAIFYSLIAFLVTFFVSFFIGIPVAYLLIRLKLDHEALSGVAGFIVILLFFEWNIENLFLIIYFGVYSFACGWAFMSGYKKGSL